MIQDEDPAATIQGSGNSQVVGTGNTQINDSTIVYGSEGNRSQQEFKKPVPKSFLDNLPRVKCQAYAEARPFWDSGVTVTMSEGNALVSSRLRQALVNTAETAYTTAFFEGKTPEEYYSQIIANLTMVSRDAMPKEGTLYGVLAGAEEIEITEDLIENLIQSISDSTYFLDWKSQWDKVEIIDSLDCLSDF